jgi:hypothetical protein
MSQRWLIEAQVRMRTSEEGGRTLALALEPYRYRPHLVLEGETEYLGVQFESGPPVIALGSGSRLVMWLMYHPHVDYHAVQPGVRFEVREGPRIVADGTVLRRWQEGECGIDG